jgi:RNA polymerase sigma factor for flagellar operon FliA
VTLQEQHTHDPALPQPASVATTHRLIEQHVPMVEQIVLRLASGFPRHVDRGELVSAGVLGLTEAAARFDPERGIPFAAFANRRIRGAVLDLMRSTDWAPRSVRAAARAADAAEQDLANRLGRSPHAAELATATGMTLDELAELRARVERGVVIALDRTYGEDSEPLVVMIVDDTVGDPQDAVERSEHRAYLRDAVRALPDRHREVIVGYFLEGRTSEDIAETLGITQSRVSQLRADALEMLRDGIEAQYQPRPTKAPSGRVERRKSQYAAAIARSSSFAARVSVGNMPIERTDWHPDRQPDLCSEA